MGFCPGALVSIVPKSISCLGWLISSGLVLLVRFLVVKSRLPRAWFCILMVRTARFITPLRRPGRSRVDRQKAREIQYVPPTHSAETSVLTYYSARGRLNWHRSSGMLPPRDLSSRSLWAGAARRLITISRNFTISFRNGQFRWNVEILAEDGIAGMIRRSMQISNKFIQASRQSVPKLYLAGASAAEFLHLGDDRTKGRC